MDRFHTPLTLFPAFVAMYLPFCAAEVRPTIVPPDAPAPSLWVEPIDLEDRDLFYGPWGREHAPRPDDRYTLVQHKHSGINPGLTVLDSEGREWSVKQASEEGPVEAPIEVVLSRVLAAMGYHQPPVYYLASFTLVDDWGTRTETGGRFRLKVKGLKDRGEWSWQQNPFVGTRPYHGLLAILMLFNSSDIKNSNNTLYEFKSAKGLEHWYVARDIGTALGTTGRLAPEKGNPDAFVRDRFIAGIRDGYVEFDYHGWHQELVRRRLTPDDVRWAGDLLARLSDRQWSDAFRAGGYEPDIAARFVAALRQRIGQTQHLAISTSAAGRPQER